MCDLIDEFEGRGYKRGMTDGISRGIRTLITTCQEFNAGFEDTANRIKACFDLNDSEVQENMRLYWK